MAPLERPSAISVEDLALAGGERVEGGRAAAGAEQAGDDLGVEGGAARRDPGDRVDELADVGDAVLEQVADAAASRDAQQVGRVPGLDVLGEHQMPTRGVGAADGDRGPQALVGVAGRHPDVDDRDVGSAATAASRASASPTAATISWPRSARISVRPARITAESSAMTMRMRSRRSGVATGSSTVTVVGPPCGL